jgi:hypothetical protein
VQHAVDMEKKQEVKMNRVIARGHQVFLELDGKVTLLVSIYMNISICIYVYVYIYIYECICMYIYT